MTESEQAQAATAARSGGRVVVLPGSPDQQPVEVPASVVKVVAEALDHVRRGERPNAPGRRCGDGNGGGPTSLTGLSIRRRLPRCHELHRRKSKRLLAPWRN